MIKFNKWFNKRSIAGGIAVALVVSVVALNWDGPQKSYSLVEDTIQTMDTIVGVDKGNESLGELSIYALESALVEMVDTQGVDAVAVLEGINSLESVMLKQSDTAIEAVTLTGSKEGTAIEEAYTEEFITGVKAFCAEIDLIELSIPEDLSTYLTDLDFTWLKGVDYSELELGYEINEWSDDGVLESQLGFLTDVLRVRTITIAGSLKDESAFRPEYLASLIEATEEPSLEPVVTEEPSLPPAATETASEEPSLEPVATESASEEPVVTVEPDLVTDTTPKEEPIVKPSAMPSVKPSALPTLGPTVLPSLEPQVAPVLPSLEPSTAPGLADAETILDKLDPLGLDFELEEKVVTGYVYDGNWSQNDLVGACSDGGTYNITDAASITASVHVYRNTTLYSSNGSGITTGTGGFDCFTVEPGVTLTVQSLRISGSSISNSVIYVKPGAALVVTTGAEICYAKDVVIFSRGTVTIYDGAVHHSAVNGGDGRNVTNHGGYLYISGGSFYSAGGPSSGVGNESGDSGEVGNANILGGSFYSNPASGFVNSSGTTSISGGSFYSNGASGAACVAGTLNVSGGNFYSNGDNGLCNAAWSTLDVSGATNCYANVKSEIRADGYFGMSGGTVSDGTYGGIGVKVVGHGSGTPWVYDYAAWITGGTHCLPVLLSGNSAYIYTSTGAPSFDLQVGTAWRGRIVVASASGYAAGQRSRTSMSSPGAPWTLRDVGDGSNITIHEVCSVGVDTVGAYNLGNYSVNPCWYGEGYSLANYGTPVYYSWPVYLDANGGVGDIAQRSASRALSNWWLAGYGLHSGSFTCGGPGNFSAVISTGAVTTGVVNKSATVTFNGNGGTVSSASISVGLPMNGWYLGASYATANGGVWTPSASGQTLTASWGATNVTGTTATRSNTVSYNLNKPSGATNNPVGSTAADTVTFTHTGWSDSTNNVAAYSPTGAISTSASKTVYACWSTTPLSLRQPTLKGWTLAGWSTSPTNATGLVGNSYTPPGNVTLYAIWQPNSYTITFNTNRPSVVNNTHASSIAPSCDTASKAVNFDYEFGTLPTPTLTGWTFNGWYRGANQLEDSQVYKTNIFGGLYYEPQDTSLYAHWTANKYTISYDANSGTGTMDPTVFTYDVPQALRTNTFTKRGYTFLGWSESHFGGVRYTNHESITNRFSTDGSGLILYAVWQRNNYSIHYNSNAAGATVSGTMLDQGFQYDVSEALNGNTFSKRDAAYRSLAINTYACKYNNTYNSAFDYRFLKWTWGFHSSERAALDFSYVNPYTDEFGTTLPYLYNNAQVVNNLTPHPNEILQFYAFWNAVPNITLKGPERHFDCYEGAVITKEMLLDKLQAFDKEDGDLTGNIGIDYIIYNSNTTSVSYPSVLKTGAAYIGSFVIKFRVTDSRGAYTTETFIGHIHPNTVPVLDAPTDRFLYFDDVVGSADAELYENLTRNLVVHDVEDEGYAIAPFNDLYLGHGTKSLTILNQAAVFADLRDRSDASELASDEVTIQYQYKDMYDKMSGVVTNTVFVVDEDTDGELPQNSLTKKAARFISSAYLDTLVAASKWKDPAFSATLQDALTRSAGDADFPTESYTRQEVIDLQRDFESEQ